MSVHVNSSDSIHRKVCRIVVMGSASVGKTAIISQFLYRSFVEEYKPTIEELHRREFEIPGQNGQYMVLEILDTSGAYQFPAMRDLSIGRADAFVLVYAIDNAESFEQVRNLREQILNIRVGGFVPPIIIVGNKCDAQLRKVNCETAETIACIDWEHGFVETSAKQAQNIDEVFKILLLRMDINAAFLNMPIEEPWRRSSLPPTGTHYLSKRRLMKRHSCVIA